MVNPHLCSKVPLYTTGEVEDKEWNPIKWIN